MTCCIFLHDEPLTLHGGSLLFFFCFSRGKASIFVYNGPSDSCDLNGFISQLQLQFGLEKKKKETRMRWKFCLFLLVTYNCTAFIIISMVWGPKFVTNFLFIHSFIHSFAITGINTRGDIGLQCPSLLERLLLMSTMNVFSHQDKCFKERLDYDCSVRLVVVSFMRRLSESRRVDSLANVNRPLVSATMAAPPFFFVRKVSPHYHPTHTNS